MSLPNLSTFRSKQDAFQALMMTGLEASYDRAQKIEPILNEIEDHVLNQVLEDCRKGALNTKTAVTIYSKLVGAVVNWEKLRLELFDRLSGNVFVEIEDAEETLGDERERENIRKTAEILLSHMVRKKLNVA